MELLKNVWLYCWHSAAAFVLNCRARSISRRVATGNPRPGDGVNLNRIGRKSNYHEARIDVATVMIKQKTRHYLQLFNQR